jgi:hypothetical protein
MHHTNENPGAGGRRSGLGGVQLGSEHTEDRLQRHRAQHAEAIFSGETCIGFIWEDRPAQYRAATRAGRDLGLYNSSYAAACALVSEARWVG